MAVKIQIRRDTSANWNAANPVLAQGEIAADLTENRIKVGDGVTAWTALPFMSGSGSGSGGSVSWANVTGKPATYPSTIPEVAGLEAALNSAGGPLQVNLSNISSSATVNMQNRNVVEVTARLTGNASLSFTSRPTGRSVVTLFLTQDSTGNRTLTLPSTTFLNGSNGSINPAGNSATVVTMFTLDGGSTWLAAVADARPNTFDPLYINPPANGDYYVTFASTTTLNLGSVTRRGTGTLVYARSTNGTSFSTVTGSTTFNANDVLRVTVSGFSGWLTFAIPRTA